jgi:UDP-glucose 4-epimerase
MNKSAFTGKIVLVTGAAGFVGSHLVEYLSKVGASVIALDNRETSFWRQLKENTPSVMTVRGSLSDNSVLKEIFTQHTPEFIFHLAGNANVPSSVKDPRMDFTANCINTLELLEAVRSYTPKSRVVLASSSAVYGEPGKDKITEDTPLKPISPYGTSKLCAEELCRIYYKTYGVQTLITRLFNCYGPRMGRFVILDFIKKLTNDSSTLEILGDGTQTRDFTYIDDVIHGLTLVAEKGIAGESYNISSGTSHTVTELAQYVIEALHLRGTTSLNYTGSSWKGDAQFWSVSICKAQLLGYTPRTELKSGVKHVVAWHKLSLNNHVDKSVTSTATVTASPSPLAALSTGIKNALDWYRRRSP